MTFLDCTIRERWIASAYETEGPFYWLTFSMLLHSPLDWAKHKITHLRRLLIVAHVRHVSPTGPSKITDFQQKDYAVYKSALVFFGLINIIYKYLFQVNILLFIYLFLIASYPLISSRMFSFPFHIYLLSNHRLNTFIFLVDTSSSVIIYSVYMLLLHHTYVMILINIIGTIVFVRWLKQKFKGIKVEQWPVTMAEYIRCNDETLFKASEKLMSAYEDELLGATSFPEYCDLTGMRLIYGNY